MTATPFRAAAAAFAVAFFAFGVLSAHAQTASEAVLTWRTTAYAPADFTGKILPVTNSYLSASVLVLGGGKAESLANHEVRWYVDDNLIRSGFGLDSVAFRAPAAPGAMEVRVEVPDLNVIQSVQIPITSPKVVIRSPYAGGFTTANPVFEARPFFFNVVSKDDLVLSWKANGEPPADTTAPEFLKVNVLPGTPANFSLILELVAKNPKNILEAAKATLSLRYSPR